jgi:hypothetical protein
MGSRRQAHPHDCRNGEFIIPVRTAANPDAGADVPESFLRVQWTRLPDGPTPATFVDRMVRLLAHVPPSSAPPAGARKKLQLCCRSFVPTAVNNPFQNFPRSSSWWR